MAKHQAGRRGPTAGGRVVTTGAVPVRRAASVLVVRDDPLRVLMMRRGAGGSFAGLRVFPGGVEEADDAALAMRHAPAATHLDADERGARFAACREVWEEVGLLLGGAGAPSAAVPRASFVAELGRTGGTVDLDALVPFGRWVTPVGLERRFDTRFFLCPAPPGQEPVVDRVEADLLEWAEPAALLAAGDGRGGLLPPTLMNLKRLAASPTCAAALAAARRLVPFTTVPVVDGAVVRIPAAAGYGQTEIAWPGGPGPR